MADQYAAQSAPSAHRLQPALKRIGLAILFLFVLIIPALRRLRRRVWVWTAIRASAIAAGGWLIQGFIYAAEGAGVLALGIALVLFGLMLRARPQVPSLDSMAHELRSLVVLNGGSYLCADSGKHIPNVHLFVNSDRVLAFSKLTAPLVEIPFSSIRDICARPVVQAPNEKQAIWNLEIRWQSVALSTAHFRYEGAFAEHLARVAESTLRSSWKKELPVLR